MERENKSTETESWGSVFKMMSKYFIPTSPQLLHTAQRALFDRFVRTPASHKVFNLKNGEYLNYVDIDKEQIESSQKKKKPTLILMHGFGSGLGMFFDNYDPFSARFDRVISIDWLGMGGSSRPKCGAAPRLPLLNGWCSTETMDPTKATDFFIDSLEEFRQENGIDNFVLAGHSLGGYLCARYAMKYPSNQMKALILISPAGLADHPPPEHQVPSSKLSTSIRLLDVMWSSNFTPQQIVRALGPKGPNTVRDVVKRRFGSDRWNETDSALIGDYLYHISAAPASGEYAMNSILKPIVSKKLESLGPTEGQKSPRGKGKNDEEEYSTAVYAREPVTPRAFSLSYQTQQQNTSSNSLFPLSPPPVLLLYGDHDWLRFPGMGRYVKEMTEDYQIPTELKIISSAGHHLYLDNTKQFHSVIDSWLDSKNIK